MYFQAGTEECHDRNSTTTYLTDAMINVKILALKCFET